jgi:hypothetical protein
MTTDQDPLRPTKRANVSLPASWHRTSLASHNQTMQPPDEYTITEESILVATLVIHLSKTLGRSYDAMPRSLKRALDDLRFEGDPTAAMLHCWLHGEPCSSQRYIPLETRQANRNPGCLTGGAYIFRHRRPWRRGSIGLRRADEERRLALLDLLKELRHVED